MRLSFRPTTPCASHHDSLKRHIVKFRDQQHPSTSAHVDRGYVTFDEATTATKPLLGPYVNSKAEPLAISCFPYAVAHPKEATIDSISIGRINPRHAGITSRLQHEAVDTCATNPELAPASYHPSPHTTESSFPVCGRPSSTAVGLRHPPPPPHYSVRRIFDNLGLLPRFFHLSAVRSRLLLCISFILPRVLPCATIPITPRT